MSITAPNGMSEVDAFAALYNHAKVIGRGELAPRSGQRLNSREEAQILYNAEILSSAHFRYPQKFVEYIQGKFMKVDLSEFPSLNIERYDERYGQGAALRALNTHSYQPLPLMEVSAKTRNFKVATIIALASCAFAVLAVIILKNS